MKLGIFQDLLLHYLDIQPDLGMAIRPAAHEVNSNLLISEEQE